MDYELLILIVKNYFLFSDASARIIFEKNENNNNFQVA